MGQRNPISVTIMLSASIARQVRAAFSRFPAANQGNIAILFAVALLPLLSFMGAAIDYTRANRARSSMQAALDSTALMLAKDLSDGKITTDQISAKASAYFTALYTNKDARSVAITASPMLARIVARRSRLSASAMALCSARRRASWITLMRTERPPARMQ